MSDQIDLQPVVNYLNNSQDILIAIAQNPTYDMIAASLSMYLSLKESGKSVNIVCPSPMLAGFSRLVGLDKIKKTAGNKNLVISFDYVQDSIEKVNYNVEDSKFNLVIQPKKGAKPLDSKSVAYTYTGLSADMIFVVGAKNFDDLGSIYLKNQETFDKAYTLSLNQSLEVNFAQTTIKNSQASSLSEITAWLLEQLGYEAKNDIASNLLSGIDKVTQRFSAPAIPGSAFVAAGKLMQNGAIRQVSTPPINKGVRLTPPKVKQIAKKPILRPMSTQTSSQITPEIKPEPETKEIKEDLNPPNEWLQPKIYNSSSKLV